ncbi:cupin domain-containing protein [Bosea thiooxidans]
MSKAPRLHIEMLPFDDDDGWLPLPGFPAGFDVKILADDLDEKRKAGARTRLVRFAAGVATTEALVHDYWEEVFVLKGAVVPPDGDASAPDVLLYSCRPPGTPHGPFRSENGCIMLEVQYYVADAA